MKNIALYFSLLLSSLLLGQEQCSDQFSFSRDSSENSQPYNHLAFQNDPCRFQFAIVTDRTGGHRPGVFMDGVNKLNLMQPEFVMSVGDLIEGYTLDTSELRRQWDEFESFVDHLEMPFFYVPGNHDITNAVMEEVWLKRFGATYYHFTYKDVLFVCLNSEDQRRGAGRGTFSDEQFKYVKKVLEQNKEVRWTMIFMHQPLWHQRDTKRWNDMEQLLAQRNHTVYAGHEHRYVKRTRNNGKYFTLATTGGGSGLRGAELGEFDHMMWVTMTDNGPIMANLDLNGIWTEDVVTEETKSLIEKFSVQSPIQIEPLFYNESAPFTQGKLKVKVTNDENIPMRITCSTENSANLALFSEKQKLEIAPNSVAFLELELLAKGEGSLEPATLKVEMQLGADGEPALVKYPYSFKLKPVKSFDLKKAKQSPKIDGKTKEWGELAYHFEEHEGEMQMDFDISYDEDYIYIAARVKDSLIESYGEGATWRQDNLSIIANASKMSRAAVSVGYEWYATEFVQQLSPANAETPSVKYRDNLPKGTKMICLQTDYGYEGELAIPLSYVRSLQGEDWQSLRLNIGVDDKDGADHMARYSWMPAWRNADNFVGSGMFFKSEDYR
jgi:hypothetical protein